NAYSGGNSGYSVGPYDCLVPVAVPVGVKVTYLHDGSGRVWLPVEERHKIEIIVAEDGDKDDAFEDSRPGRLAATADNADEHKELRKKIGGRLTDLMEEDGLLQRHTMRHTGDEHSGVYVDSTGTRWETKAVKMRWHAEAEGLLARAYQLGGFDTAEVRV